MNFVELNRHFVLVAKDREPTSDYQTAFGRKFGGWLNWPKLLDHRRVVLLAEASSGKSEEFRNQAQQLALAGRPAFYLRVEELSDQGFEAALSPQEAETFAAWRLGTDDGFFFLDSVDEARLNRKSFDSALKRFARDVGEGLPRAHVYISCRVTDWRNQSDRPVIERILPAWERAKLADIPEDANPLLDPIFRDSKTTSAAESGEAREHELIVVQLAALDAQQRRLLAIAAGVSDVQGFMNGLQQSGLESFAERPGDLVALAIYWNDHGIFSRLAVMVESAICNKLKELDPGRPDNTELSETKARAGAERLAAALTLGKSFSLRAPGADPDPSLSSGALDPTMVLDDWTSAERNALLRRGIFAPSTFGRIRFHHRSTQEYLTAKWFERLLDHGGARREIWRLFFVEQYGVETVVPSLRPEAAWLALTRQDVRSEIIRREPVVLIQHGDAASLSIEARSSVLRSWANKDKQGDVADDGMDTRALWMFADAALADALRDAWRQNERPEFRIEILRLIREGAVSACADLARAVAEDEDAADYHRIVGVQALKECGQTQDLHRISRRLLEKPGEVSLRFAASLCDELFPANLSVTELFEVIDNAKPELEHGTEGFSYRIAMLYERCLTKDRQAFVKKLADLCLAPPHIADYRPLSARHRNLAGSVAPIARREIELLDARQSNPDLVRLLMVVERADDRSSDSADASLFSLVAANRKLKRALFWANVNVARDRSVEAVTRYWQARQYVRNQLWDFDDQDRAWLEADIANEPLLDDRRVALSALTRVLLPTMGTDAARPILIAAASSDAVLGQDVADLLAPPSDRGGAKQHARTALDYKIAREKETEANKKSWIAFEQSLRENPELLRDKEAVTSWEASAVKLYNLVRWLEKRTKSQSIEATRQWRLLEEAFGSEIAQAFRDGMKLLWRGTRPERPIRKPGAPVSMKNTTMLAFAGVGLEAAEDFEWATRLTEAEAKQAALHACYSERGYPAWLDDLFASHTEVVGPVVAHEVKREWSATEPGGGDFLRRYADSRKTIPISLHNQLFKVIVSPASPRLDVLDQGLSILRILRLNDAQKKTLTSLGRKLIRNLNDKDRALRGIAMLMIVDPKLSIQTLAEWLNKNRAYAVQAFSILFGPHDGIAVPSLSQAQASDLEQLLELSYRYVRPADDLVHETVYTPGIRDDAESARGGILNKLVELPGYDAYQAMSRSAKKPAFRSRAIRFREIARLKAQRDSEPPAWTEVEVVLLERKSISPAKTGAQLLRLTIDVLNEMQHDLKSGDVSSRPLLQRAKDEDEVKNWLVEQMNLRGRGRFQAFREVQVAGEKRPDVIVASTAAPVQVALEVKHGGKDWSIKDFELALKRQLAEDYLKPEERRHGILVVSNHRHRSWRHPKRGMLEFGEVLALLRSAAAKVQRNDSGAVTVDCAGIDAT